MPSGSRRNAVSIKFIPGHQDGMVRHVFSAMSSRAANWPTCFAITHNSGEFENRILIEVGRRIRLKRNIPLLIRLLESGAEGYRFDFYVVSAAPEEVVRSAHG